MRLALALLVLLAPAAHAQWVRVDTLGLPQFSIFSVSAVVASDAAVHALAGFNPNRLYRSTDHGDTWTLVAPVAGGAGLYQGEATVVAHRPGVDLHISTDEGLTWTLHPATVAPFTEYFSGVARAEASGTRAHAVITSTSSRLFVTTDDFATMVPKLASQTFFRVASNGSVLVATTGSGPDALFVRSTDAGQTWAPSEASGLGSQFLYASRDSFFVSGIAPASGARVLVASADGAAWTEIASGAVLTVAPALASSARHAAVVTYAQAPSLQVAFFTSVQSGRDPSHATGDYPTAQVGPNAVPCVATGAFVAVSSTHAYALANCTRGGQAVINALYRRPLGGGSTQSADAPVDPHALALSVPAPHPVATTSRVSFTIATSGPVRLALYDVLGRRVATLADGTQAAGTHTVTLDARRLASGPYALRLDAGGHHTARLVTVTR